jgi:hypothetical protein
MRKGIFLVSLSGVGESLGKTSMLEEEHMDLSHLIHYISVSEMSYVFQESRLSPLLS